MEHNSQLEQGKKISEKIKVIFELAAKYPNIIKLYHLKHIYSFVDLLIYNFH